MYKRIVTLVTLTALLLISTLLYASANSASLPPTANSLGQRASRSSGTLVFLPFVSKSMGTVPLAPLWRFGVARARRPITDYDSNSLAAMRFGWFLDWGAGSTSIPAYGMEYVPMVRVKQWKLNGSTPTASPCAGCPYLTPYTYTLSLTTSQIQSIASSRPGMTWLIGNEIERRDWGTCGGCGQDEIVPELYAVAYHDVWATIKAADPTAQVAIGGVIQATPLRLRYLQRIWDSYLATYGAPMPVDVWNVHAFVLNETTGWGAGIPAGIDDTLGEAITITPEQNKDFTMAQGHILALRTWMQQHGQQNKPLIITEYGVNIPANWCYSNGVCPFTADQVRSSYMYPSFDFFINATNCRLSSIDGCHLVQRWNWYSLDDDAIDPSTGQQAYNGNLFSSGLNSNSMGVAPLGTYWAQYVSALPPGAGKPY